MSPSQVSLLLGLCLAAANGQELCNTNDKEIIDGVLPGPGNEVLLVKGENYWKLDGNLTEGFSLNADYPKKLHTRWPEMNVTVDQAFYDLEDSVTYFVKDDLCWAYNDTVLLPGYPRPANEDPNVSYAEKEDNTHPDPNPETESELSEQFHTFGIFPWDIGHMYFFNGTQYTKYRLPLGPIEPGFPKDVVPFWFQCPEVTSEDLIEV